MKELIEQLAALNQQHDLSGFYSIYLSPWEISLQGHRNDSTLSFVKTMNVNGADDREWVRFKKDRVRVVIDSPRRNVTQPADIIEVGPDLLPVECIQCEKGGAA